MGVNQKILKAVLKIQSFWKMHMIRKAYMASRKMIIKKVEKIQRAMKRVLQR